MLWMLSSIGNDVIQSIDHQKNYGYFAPIVMGTKSFGASVYNTLLTVAIFGGAVMLVVAFILYMGTTGKAKDDAKKKITWILLGVALSLLTLSIVAVVYNAGSGS